MTSHMHGSRNPRFNPHKDKPGFVVARRNPTTRNWNCAYTAEPGAPDQYVAVCEMHQTRAHFATHRELDVALPHALWCDPCKELVRQHSPWMVGYI